MDEQMEDVWMDRWMDGKMDGWITRLTDGLMGGWPDGRMPLPQFTVEYLIQHVAYSFL